MHSFAYGHCKIFVPELTVFCSAPRWHFPVAQLQSSSPTSWTGLSCACREGCVPGSTLQLHTSWRDQGRSLSCWRCPSASPPTDFSVKPWHPGCAGHPPAWSSKPGTARHNAWVREFATKEFTRNTHILQEIGTRF